MSANELKRFRSRFIIATVVGSLGLLLLPVVCLVNTSERAKHAEARITDIIQPADASGIEKKDAALPSHVSPNRSRDFGNTNK